MKINLKATNIDLTAGLRDQVNEKFGGLDKYFSNIQQVDVEIGKTSMKHKKGDIFFCEANISVPRKLLRFRKEADDLQKAVTETKKGIQQEIKKYKEQLEN